LNFKWFNRRNLRKYELSSDHNVQKFNNSNFDKNINPDLHYYNGNNKYAYCLEYNFKVEFDKAKEIYDLSIIHLNNISLVKICDDLKDLLINIKS